MNAIFLNSSMDLYDKDEFGVKTPHNFGNRNKILENYKKYIKKYDNFLFVASNEIEHDVTDVYFKCTTDSFKQTLPFKNYILLDGRNKNRAKELIENADFIYLCGGHVPTQLKFFNNIKLRDLIKNTNAVISGASAGSMDCADVVYCPPELEEEFLDKNFNRYLKGLGLTNINIFPHYDKLKDESVAGFYHTDYCIKPDSYKGDIIVLVDGSYILIDGDVSTIYGEAYLARNGEIKQICSENKTIQI